MLHNDLSSRTIYANEQFDAIWNKTYRQKEQILCHEFKTNPAACADMLKYLGEHPEIARKNIDFTAKFIRCIPSELAEDTYLEKISSLIKKDQLLLQACREALPLNYIEELIANGSSPYCSDTDGTPLHHVTATGSIEAIIALLKSTKTNYLETIDSLGRTPLHIACQHGLTQVVITLVSYGFKADSQDHFGMSPLHYACQYGDRAIFKILIKNPYQHASDYFGNTYLHYASKYKMARAIIYNGHIDQLEARNQLGLTPLHLAVRSKNHKLLLFYTQTHADLNISDHEGNTPLHYAVLKDNITAVQILLNAKVNVDARNKNGMTPTHIVCKTGNLQIFSILSFKKVNLNALDNLGNTPLHYSCIERHLKLVFLLIHKKVKLNILNKVGMTPLHYASQNGQQSIFAYLLQIGEADSRIADKTGNTPLHYACRHNHYQLARDLLDEEIQKTDLMTLNHALLTPLCYAVLQQNTIANFYFSDFNFLKGLNSIDSLANIEPRKWLNECVAKWLKSKPQCIKGRSFLEVPLLLGMRDFVQDELNKMPIPIRKIHWLILNKTYPQVKLLMIVN